MPKFRILAGQHLEGKHLYRKGEVVETESNLLKFNAPGMSPKFEKVEDDTPASYQAAATTEGKAEGKASAEQLTTQQPPRAPTPPGPPAPPGQPPAAPSQRPADFDLKQLDTMSVRDLQALAAEEEIDLKGERTRDGMARVIKQALQAG